MTADEPLRAAALRCAQQVNPLGVAPGRVRLSWLVEGDGRAQRAYQVQVAPDETRLATGEGLWVSGRVEASSPTEVAYAGWPGRQPAGDPCDARMRLPVRRLFAPAG